MPLSAVETFEHIIRQQSAQELVPFLLELPKMAVVPVRQHAKSLKRELEQFVQVAPNSWGSRGTSEQHWMLFLTGLRTYSRKEALTARFGGWWPELANRPAFWAVVEHTRPDWLLEWLQRWATGNRWGTPAYRLLRALEERQLIPYEPQLFAVSAANLLNDLRQPYEELITTGPINLPELILAELRADKVLLQRDLPLVFDFETNVDGARVWLQNRSKPDDVDWVTWNQQHPAQTVTWTELLPALAASGHLDRADLLMRSLLALRRDLRRPLLTWFKALYLALQPSAAERLAAQQELVELLAHPQPLVVNFALDQLKGIWLEPGFDTAPLLLYAEGLMTRADLKTGLRGLLTGLEKLLRHDATLASALAPLATAALANADAAVQERAAKLLVGLLGAKKSLLTTAQVADTVAAISLYVDLLGAAARTALAPWLTVSEAATETAEIVSYEPRAEFVPELSAATALVPVQDWHELLFLTGQVLQHDDPAALERWVDGLLRLRRQFPVDYAEPLQPYLLQIMPHLKSKTAEERAAILRQPATEGHLGLVHALLIGWASGFVEPLVQQVDIRGRYSVSDPLLGAEQQRLHVAEQRLRDSLPLPLLSTPTHAPAWLAPTALVQRLLAHEAVRQAPDAADLAVALARTAHAHPAEAAAALTLLPQLQNAPLRELLTWLLSPTEQPLPAELMGRKSVLKQLTTRLSQLLPGPATPDHTLSWLWAVAARTKYPAGRFAELATVADYAGGAAPWQPQWKLVAKSHTYVEQWKPGKPEKTNRWVELSFLPTDSGRMAPSPLLLYSLHARFAGMQNAMWTLAADFPFLANMLPNNPAPLHWHVLRGLDLRSGYQEYGSPELISQALTSLLGEGPRFDEAATLLLAVGLTFHGPAGRAVALEVLLSAVEESRLEPAALGRVLGQLLAAELVPIQRLADSLAQARAINPRTDDALCQLLDALLPLLPATPLRNTRKLLDAYADLLARMSRPAPAALQLRLREWSGVSAVKKAAAALLA